ncbi:hypothetical protein NYO91_15080 [Arhodomonas aquaeolei]|uniref:hypothetical protein n=1 Tax=Arhodomonas aquaeolei TaxID=2369 RepID=UPI0021678C35|nr:hypothetical protein [Arhodomonas aquaeolei]MCS4505407.1 hypothetical protein [Arhodomonas aquaeolei]
MAVHHDTPNTTECARRGGSAPSPSAGLAGALRDAVRRRLRAWRTRLALNRVMDMDDHLLRDIGVTRQHVCRAVDRAGRRGRGQDLCRR